MRDWVAEFDEFDQQLSAEIDEVSRDKSIDYQKYIEALNIYAADCLGVKGKDYIILKPVYLHGTKIHSLIFNVCMNGRRYSARLIRRVSLGLRERESDKWITILKKAYEVALSMPPVGLDPKLRESKYWFSSNRNSLRLTFKLNDSCVIINSTKIRKAYGEIEELSMILNDLKERGL